MASQLVAAQGQHGHASRFEPGSGRPRSRAQAPASDDVPASLVRGGGATPTARTAATSAVQRPAVAGSAAAGSTTAPRTRSASTATGSRSATPTAPSALLHVRQPLGAGVNQFQRVQRRRFVLGRQQRQARQDRRFGTGNVLHTVSPSADADAGEADRAWRPGSLGTAWPVPRYVWLRCEHSWPHSRA